MKADLFKGGPPDPLDFNGRPPARITLYNAEHDSTAIEADVNYRDFPDRVEWVTTSPVDIHSVVQADLELYSFHTHGWIKAVVRLPHRINVYKNEGLRGYVDITNFAWLAP